MLKLNDPTVILLGLWVLGFGGAYVKTTLDKLQQAKDDAARYRTAYKLVRR
jgi:hypothetical protein